MSSPASAANPIPGLRRVLVVDDTATNRQILSVFLRKFGYQVDMAEDGAQAVEKFRTNLYDLVIMDVMMPVMDGFEATRRIKRICGERWVPVIFLSALDKDESLVAGLEAGGDDYLPKPVNFVVLEAKLRSLGRSLTLRRELEIAHDALRKYKDAREAENALASDIYNRLMRRPGLADPALHYWMTPASHFSGDIVAATRAADGRLYVLLADATGHGLGAAISVLPVLTLFYDLTSASVPLGRVVAKINSQLREALPIGRFVACSCLCVDPAKGGSEIWMGGMPPILVIDKDGRCVREVTSTHFALGIDDFHWSSAAGEKVGTPAGGGQIVMFSDGLIEARSPAGEEFGVERLSAALEGAPAGERLAVVQEAVSRHLGGDLPHDDVSLILVDLPVAPDDA
jgi:CheY-like chemotaxis protein